MVEHIHQETHGVSLQSCIDYFNEFSCGFLLVFCAIPDRKKRGMTINGTKSYAKEIISSDIAMYR